MRLEVYPNYISLTPESHLENEAIKRWRESVPTVQSGVTGLADVPWSATLVPAVFDIRITFIPKGDA